MSLHHHRLLATVCEDEHKPSVAVYGDAVNDGTESAVTPFGVEKIKPLRKHAEVIRLEFLIRPLPCESRITFCMD